MAKRRIYVFNNNTASAAHSARDGCDYISSADVRARRSVGRTREFPSSIGDQGLPNMFCTIWGKAAATINTWSLNAIFYIFDISVLAVSAISILLLITPHFERAMQSSSGRRGGSFAQWTRRPAAALSIDSSALQQ